MTVTIRGYGMWTAAGHDGPSTVAAMRAGVSGAERANLWDYSVGENLSAFRVAAHQWWEGSSFVPYLIAPVIGECWDRLSELGIDNSADVPILINIAPKDRPARNQTLERIVIDTLPILTEGPLPPGSTVVSAGRVGLPYLLAKTRALRQPSAILVGAESLLQQSIADHYAEQQRLFNRLNSSGFTLGEAAAALIVSSGAHPGLQITGMGHGNDSSVAGGNKDTPVDGSGLTDAMRMALADADIQFYDITVSMADLNGEHFKFKEHAVATMRLDRLPPEKRSRRPREHLEHWNVVETIGETGAAHMFAACGWAYQAGRSGYLPGRVMLSAGEDDGQRVALVAEWSDG